MEIKKRMILNHMLDKNTYITSEELSMLLKVSPRTIMRYVKDINYMIRRYNAEITSARGLGYRLQVPERDKKALLKSICSVPSETRDDTDESRNEKIIRCILNERENTTDKLAISLNLSSIRISQLLDIIRGNILGYGLELQAQKSRGLRILGNEKDIRTMMLDLLLDKTEERIVDFLENLSIGEAKEVKRITQKKLVESDQFISDFDFKLLYLEILISLSRCKRNRGFQEEQPGVPRDIILAITSEISFMTGINLDEKEQVYIDNELGDILDSYQREENDDITDFIEEKLAEFEQITGKNYLEDLQLVNSLKLHIALFIKRSRKGMETDNPIISQIKKNLPTDFDLAALMAIGIERKFSVCLSENEIGFLTLHFASFEERRKNQDKKKIVIICHYGIGTSQLLKEKLQNRYEEFLVVGIYPQAFLEVAMKVESDLIISTVEIKGYENRAIIYIDNIFSEEIFVKINRQMDKKSKMEKILNNLFSRDTFIKVEATSRKDMILKMGEFLIGKGYTSQEVLDEVFKREDMSSTDIGNLVAIPHTISKYQEKSFISVGILKDPVFWSKENVQLVFLICFNSNDKENLGVFRYLYNFIKDEGSVKSIINFADYDIFRKIIDNKR